jgi:hypothetical protein
MDNSQIETAYNDTFPGLTLYFRDCDLNPEFVSKYQVGQILMERGFTDVSGFAEGLGKNLRYAIASNKAANMGQFNPDVAKFGFHLISAPSYYKVLDIYTIGDQTQILLLNFQGKFLEVFKETNTDVEKKVAGMGRQNFEAKMELEPNAILYESEWIERTQFPIGMTDDGVFFPLITPNTETPAQTLENQPEKNIPEPQKGESQTKPESQPKPDPKEEKKGFWKRLFG